MNRTCKLKAGFEGLDLSLKTAATQGKEKIQKNQKFYMKVGYGSLIF
jgi:hypothetical protein